MLTFCFNLARFYGVPSLLEQQSQCWILSCGAVFQMGVAFQSADTEYKREAWSPTQDCTMHFQHACPPAAHPEDFRLPPPQSRDPILNLKQNQTSTYWLCLSKNPDK
jgi:hypothetical protein